MAKLTLLAVGLAVVSVSDVVPSGVPSPPAVVPSAMVVQFVGKEAAGASVRLPGGVVLRITRGLALAALKLYVPELLTSALARIVAVALLASVR